MTSPKGRRAKMVTIRVSEDELRRLEELAAREGLTVSAYVRRLAYASPPPSAVPPSKDRGPAS